MNTAPSNNTAPHDIFRAAAEGDLAAIRRYLAAGHNVNVFSLAQSQFCGMAPLHAAAEAGQAEAVQLLLEAGADVDAADKHDHWTPLHHAADEEHADVLRLLLEHGAMVDSIGSEGETPLHMAAMCGFTEGVRLLLRAGADPNQRGGGTRETPLYHAAATQSAGCARLLLEAGADVNARCFLGCTPLDVLNEEGHGNPDSALCELLRSRGGKTGAELDAGTPTPPALPRGSTRLHDILKTLVSFRSDADHPQEKLDCLDYVESLLMACSVPHIRRLGSGQKQQLIAALNCPALKDIRHGLMLCGHLDVVPGDEEQFDLYSVAGHLFGRGTADMKGSIACFLHLLPLLAEQPFPVVLAFTTDEESDMEGIRQVCNFLREKRIRPTLTLLGEPTGEHIGTESSGLCGFVTGIEGKAAHSSRPQDGINALYTAARLLNRLETLGQESASRGLYVNAGQLTGGNDPATVPDHATLHWGFRCFAPEQEEPFMESFERAVRQVELQYPGCTVETECCCRFPAFRAGAEATELADALSCALGYPTASIPYTTEANFLQEAGQRVLLLGAGHPREAHREDEEVHAAELASYEKALQGVCRMLARQNSEKKT